MSNRHVYLMLHRPVGPGTCPKGFIEYENFDERQMVLNVYGPAWGTVLYDRELTQKELDEYEMELLC